MSTKQIAALICRTYKDIKTNQQKKETLNIIMIWGKRGHSTCDTRWHTSYMKCKVIMISLYNVAEYQNGFSLVLLHTMSILNYISQIFCTHLPVQCLSKRWLKSPTCKSFCHRNMDHFKKKSQLKSCLCITFQHCTWWQPSWIQSTVLADVQGKT